MNRDGLLQTPADARPPGVCLMEIECAEVSEGWDEHKLLRCADKMERWVAQMRFKAETMKRAKAREACN